MDQKPLQDYRYEEIILKRIERTKELKQEYDCPFSDKFTTKNDFHKINIIRNQISLQLFNIKDYLDLPFITGQKLIQYIDGVKEEYSDQKYDSEGFLKILKFHKLDKLNGEQFIKNQLVQNTIEIYALKNVQTSLDNQYAAMKSEFPSEFQLYQDAVKNNEFIYDNSEENLPPNKKLIWTGSTETLIYVINGLQNLGYIEFPKIMGSHEIDMDKVIMQLKQSFDFKQIKEKHMKEYLGNKSDRKYDTMEKNVIKRLKYFFGDRINFTPDKLNESKLFFLCPKRKIKD